MAYSSNFWISSLLKIISFRELFLYLIVDMNHRHGKWYSLCFSHLFLKGLTRLLSLFNKDLNVAQRFFHGMSCKALLFNNKHCSKNICLAVFFLSVCFSIWIEIPKYLWGILCVSLRAIHKKLRIRMEKQMLHGYRLNDKIACWNGSLNAIDAYKMLTEYMQ